MFFTGLSCTLLYLHYCFDDAPMKLVTAINKVFNNVDIFCIGNLSVRYIQREVAFLVAQIFDPGGEARELVSW